MNDPDVISRVHRDTDRRSQQPVIRERLGEERVHLEHGSHASGAWCSALPGCACAHECDHDYASEKIERAFHRPSSVSVQVLSLCTYFVGAGADHRQIDPETDQGKGRPTGPIPT